jgi:tRNA threonylcarbamoyladenosine biosynthesis protein TsaB
MRTPEDALSGSSDAGIRAMSQSDVSALLSILAESPEASLWSEASLLETCSSGSAWIAEREGRVVGFLIGRVAADEFEILNVAVARSNRRRGIASGLVKAALEWSRTAGARRAYLEVRASNEAAIALYVRHEFCICGRRARYYQHPVEDAMVLSRDWNEIL